MNESYSTKKRKKSFANDRLKKLRTTINNDSKSTHTEIQKQISTPSVKGSIPNNPQGYPERKKIKATRRLKSNDCNKYSDSLSAFEVKQISTPNETKDSSDACPSKRRKIDEFQTFSNPAASKSSSSCTARRNSSGNTNLHRKSSSTSIKRNDNSIITNTTSINSNRKENFSDPTLKKYSSLGQAKHEASPKNIKKSSVSARLEAIQGSSIPKFPNICSAKEKFEYSHKPTSATKEKSTIPSKNSKNYGEYVGQALNALYGKLFGNQENLGKEGLCNEGNTDKMDWEPEVHSSSVAGNSENTNKQEMYIIVDTNIFLDSLSFLEGIIEYGSKDGLKPVIYVPWMVFNELDFIKDNRSGMKFAACKAIDFINKMLLDQKGKLIGQSIFEANKQIYVGKSPDDKITSCCLQVKEKGINVVLLSNDKNLRNKLIINGIPSFSCTEFLNSYDDFPPQKSKTNESSRSSDFVPPQKSKINLIFDEMRKCCTSIIIECCEEAYGSVWNKLALLDKQPWDFKMCLGIFKKYWAAVFRDKLLKQFLMTVEKMMTTLGDSRSLRNPSSFDSFTEDCLNLCFFLMDLEQHKSMIEETASKISSIIKDKS